MADYQRMYHHLFSSITDILELLQETQQQIWTQQRMLSHAISHLEKAQQETEEMYLQAGRPMAEFPGQDPTED